MTTNIQKGSWQQEYANTRLIKRFVLDIYHAFRICSRTFHSLEIFQFWFLLHMRAHLYMCVVCYLLLKNVISFFSFSVCDSLCFVLFDSMFFHSLRCNFWYDNVKTTNNFIHSHVSFSLTPYSYDNQIKWTITMNLSDWCEGRMKYLYSLKKKHFTIRICNINVFYACI